MPLTPDELDAIEEMLNEVDTIVGEATPDDGLDARSVFREAFEIPSGGVEPLEEPATVYKKDVTDLADIPKQYESVYGLDAGTTRPESYTNGLVIDVANAKAAMLGDGNADIERMATIIGAYHHKDENVDVDNKILRTGDITSRLISVDPRASRSVRDQVKNRGRTMAEGQHAETIASELDGPLFIDGPIYPMSVMTSLVFAKEQAVSGEGLELTESAGKSQGKEIVDHYVHAIDTQMDNGYPVIGIVKTMRTSAVVDAIEEKLRTGTEQEDVTLPWNRDDQFLSDALHTTDPDGVTFTSWLLRTSSQRNGEEVEPLDGFDIADDREPEEYRQAFFYVRLPTSGTVFRVEVPLMMVLDEDERERIRLTVLRQMVRAGDTPAVVKRADDRARISQETAKDLKNSLFHRVKGYNRDGRYEDISYQNNENHTNEDY